MSLYRIVPERSYVWIDARSNVHPIHSKTNGLEGFIDFEMTPDGSVDLTSRPAGQLSLAVSRLSSGNPMEDRELRRRIDAGKYPKIEGVLEQIVPSGDPREVPRRRRGHLPRCGSPLRRRDDRCCP